MLAAERRKEIQSCHTLGKPKCSKISSKNGQDTESKALVMSTFKSRAAHFLV
jgi:hypothetical protein